MYSAALGSRNWLAFLTWAFHDSHSSGRGAPPCSWIPSEGSNTFSLTWLLSTPFSKASFTPSSAHSGQRVHSVEAHGLWHLEHLYGNSEVRRWFGHHASRANGSQSNGDWQVSQTTTVVIHFFYLLFGWRPRFSGAGNLSAVPTILATANKQRPQLSGKCLNCPKIVSDLLTGPHHDPLLLTPRTSSLHNDQNCLTVLISIWSANTFLPTELLTVLVPT